MQYFKVNDYYTELKFPFESILKKDVILDGRFDRHDTWGLTFIPIDEMIDRSARDFFNDIGLDLKTIYFMYGPANKKLVIHVDGYIDNNGSYHGMLCGLNWIFGSTNHSMNWYTSNSLGETSINKEGLKRTKWSDENCFLAQQVTINKPTLVRTDVPHNVINSSSEKRFCVSLRFKDQNLKYEDAKKLLSSYIDNEIRIC